jgi:myo-inositol-1(or 4)-monophosphatase
MLSKVIPIAREAGQMLRADFGKAQTINEAASHDIKLQMDVDCQRMIERRLLEEFPGHSIIGEEGIHGNPQSEHRWVVDPLDGTVNYTYGIPHFCVSIALQRRSASGPVAEAMGGYESVLGVILDPIRDELFAAEKGKGAFCNERRLQVSNRARLGDAILSVGFAKTADSIEEGLRRFQILVRSARKLRTLGSAALDLAYIAAGRIESYMESRISLWDIAAGVLLVEEAGGRIELKANPSPAYSFEILSTNGKVDGEIKRAIGD